MSFIQTRKLGLVLITPLFILLAHYLAMLPHEYAHSVTAWILGYKNNPFNLNYGGTSWLNVLLLAHMDENVSYDVIFSTGHGIHAAIVAFAGVGFANIPLFILSLWLLKKKSVKNQAYLYYFLFLFDLMNLGNFYDYIPIRTFATHGDMTNFRIGLNISPWWIYIIGGYIAAFLIWNFFTKTMIAVFINLKISTNLRASLMIMSVGILFGFYGVPGFFSYGEISYFLSATSIISIPGLITALWPTREWVITQLNLYK